MNNDNIVKVLWNSQDGPEWNECCAMVLEVFGLPGDRFICHPKDEHMEIEFTKSTDAVLCKILLSEKVLTGIAKT